VLKRKKEGTERNASALVKEIVKARLYIVEEKVVVEGACVDQERRA